MMVMADFTDCIIPTKMFGLLLYFLTSSFEREGKTHNHILMLGVCPPDITVGSCIELDPKYVHIYTYIYIYGSV